MSCFRRCVNVINSNPFSEFTTTLILPGNKRFFFLIYRAIGVSAHPQHTL